MTISGFRHLLGGVLDILLVGAFLVGMLLVATTNPDIDARDIGPPPQSPATCEGNCRVAP